MSCCLYFCYYIAHYASSQSEGRYGLSKVDGKRKVKLLPRERLSHSFHEELHRGGSSLSLKLPSVEWLFFMVVEFEAFLYMNGSLALLLK